MLATEAPECSERNDKFVGTTLCGGTSLGLDIDDWLGVGDKIPLAREISVEGSWLGSVMSLTLMLCFPKKVGRSDGENSSCGKLPVCAVLGLDES